MFLMVTSPVFLHLTWSDELVLLVDDDDGDDEETGQVDAVQQHQEPLPDDPSGDQLLEGEGRAHGEVAICKFNI